MDRIVGWKVVGPKSRTTAWPHQSPWLSCLVVLVEALNTWQKWQEVVGPLQSLHPSSPHLNVNFKKKKCLFSLVSSGRISLSLPYSFTETLRFFYGIVSLTQLCLGVVCVCLFVFVYYSAKWQTRSLTPASVPTSLHLLCLGQVLKEALCIWE